MIMELQNRLVEMLKLCICFWENLILTIRLIKQVLNLLFAQALNKFNLPFDLHIFSKGPHDLGLGEDEPTVAIWPKICEKWLQVL